jgi:hypothetical protein
LRADVVFEGEVAQIKRTPPQVNLEHPEGPVSSSGDPLIATFRVMRVYKGDVPGRVDVHTVAGGGSCGFGFREGRRYVVFARSAGAALQTGLCDGTTDGALPFYLRSFRFRWLIALASLVIAGLFVLRHFRQTKTARAGFEENGAPGKT